MMDLQEFLARFPPPSKLLFAKVWGSRSHNTHKPTSDTDFMGVYVYPLSTVLAAKFPHEEGWKEGWKHDTGEPEPGAPPKNKDENPDYDFMEVGRFAELLLKGNPGLIEMLYTDRMTLMTPLWEELRAIRDKFLCQEVVKQYIGYMGGQLRRLIAHNGQKGLHTKGGSYNEKWAYHILRLAEDSCRIATGRRPEVWKETGSPEHTLLMRVRNNEFAWEQVKEMIQTAIHRSLGSPADPMPPWEEKKAYEAWLDKGLSALTIPKYGDKDALNKWLWKVRMENP